MHAGNTVIQFARGRDEHGTLLNLAIKFFASFSDYEEETLMYQLCPEQLRSFMPKVLEFVGNKDGSVMDPFGTKLMPFIVMEKGESLKDRAGCVQVEVFTTAQVRCNLALVYDGCSIVFDLVSRNSWSKLFHN